MTANIIDFTRSFHFFVDLSIYFAVFIDLCLILGFQYDIISQSVIMKEVKGR